MPSSPSQKQSLLADLLDILESVLDVVSSSISPHEENRSSHRTPPQDDTAHATTGRQDSTFTPLRVVVESMPPSPPPTPEQKIKNENEERRKQDAEKREGRKLIAETILAIVTTLILGVNIWLVCTTRDSNKLIHANFIRSQRPWVGVNVPQITKYQYVPNTGYVDIHHLFWD